MATIAGLIFAYLLGGTVMVEYIFSWPGIGNYVVQSVAAVDYAPVEGFVIVLAQRFLVPIVVRMRDERHVHVARNVGLPMAGRVRQADESEEDKG